MFSAKLKISIKSQDKIKHSLTFYKNPPTETISLQDFEEFAEARLKLLRTIERTNLSSLAKYGSEWRRDILSDLKRQNLEYFIILVNNQAETERRYEEAKKFDAISHYLLRLAYFRNEELRRWFINMEIEFLKLKNFNTTNDEIKRFFKDELEMDLKPIDEKELEELWPKILNCSFYSIGNNTSQKVDIYKFDFEHVLDLVRGRKVFLKNGMAYIPHYELINIVITIFRHYLSKSLAVMTKLSSMIDDDERLSGLLQDFDKRHTGKSYAIKDGQNDAVTVEMLSGLSKKSFPLCMKNLYDVVTTEYHTKHYGRLQLGLFLKGIGVPLEESIRFWRDNFTKKSGFDSSRFEKQYLYGVRHSYGHEGKRADYTPYSCIKVIMSNVGPGEHHGCPFRHSDQANLRAKLVQAEIANSSVKEIMDLVEGHHYQIACQKYFEFTHNKNTVEGGVNHPNQYFEESQNVIKGKPKKSEDPLKNIQTIKASVYEKKGGGNSNEDTQIIKANYLNENPELIESMISMIDDEDEVETQIITGTNGENINPAVQLEEQMECD